MNMAKERCMGCMTEKEFATGFCVNCGYSPEMDTRSPHHLPLGTLVSERYQVGRVIGEGGFGITYIAFDIHTDTKLTIKEYFPAGFVSRNSAIANSVIVDAGEKADFFAKGLNCYVEEARRLASLSTLQGVVGVKDCVLENGTAYIVMEYIDGITLKSEIQNRGGYISEHDLLEMAKPLVRSLIEVHKAGIVHRDISPDNIMITSAGEMKLLDFGAARCFAENTNIAAALKRGFAPIEQYHGDSNQGPWTDVYGLCATLYTALNGTVPPDSSERVYTDTLVGLTAPISHQTSDVILKGLAVQWEYRWQNMQELYDALYGSEQTIAMGPDATQYASVTQQPYIPVDAAAIYQQVTAPADANDAYIPATADMQPLPESDTAQSVFVQDYSDMVSTAPPIEPLPVSKEEDEKINSEPRRPQKQKMRPAHRALMIGSMALSVVLLAAVILLIFTRGNDDDVIPASSGVDISVVSQIETEGEPGYIPPDFTAATVIEWKDKTFEELIRQVLDRPQGDILAGEVATIDLLAISGNEVSIATLDINWFATQGTVASLEDIVYFKGLSTLIMASNPIADITPISALPALKHLTLYNCKIEDISPLAGITTLETLNCAANRIADISPLSGLVGLTAVDFSSNIIEDITPIGGLHSLRTAMFENNHISNITDIGNLSALTDLRLGKNRITDISELATLSNLELLTLYHNEIEEFSSLQNLTSLTLLNLEKTGISDLSMLSNLVNMQYLYLGYNNITDITPLQGMERLEILYLTGNNISDISVVEELQTYSLAEIDISGNPAAAEEDSAAG